MPPSVPSFSLAMTRSWKLRKVVVPIPEVFGYVVLLEAVTTVAARVDVVVVVAVMVEDVKGNDALSVDSVRTLLALRPGLADIKVMRVLSSRLSPVWLLP